MPYGSLNAFKNTLARKKARDNKKTSLFDLKIENKANDKTNFKKVNTNELEQIKTSIKRRLKSENRKKRIIYTITFIVTTLVTIVFLAYLVN